MNLVGEPGQAEVGHDYLTAAVEHDVGGLQVAMEYAFGMGSGQARAELSRDVGCFVLRQTPDAAQQGRQVFAIDIFHREKRVAIDFADVIHAADVRMRDPARDADFVAEALEEIFVASCLFGKKLERDWLAERKVICPIDFSHAAFA